MEVIEQIGSYAGFAAVVGLAVLAALYFSQARDVRRLREWAGRAPERVAQTMPPTRQVVSRPVPRPPGAPGTIQPPQPRPPGAPGARAATAGATPAIATGPGAATPAARAGAAASGTAAQGQADGASDDTALHPPPAAGDAGTRTAAAAGAGGDSTDDGHEPAQDGESLEQPVPLAEGEGGLSGEEGAVEDRRRGEQDGADGGPGAPDADGSSRPGVPAPATSAGAQRLPATGPVGPLPPRPAPVGQGAVGRSGPILPPYARSRPGAESWETRSISPRRAALMIGAIVVALAVATLGVLSLVGDGGEPEPSAQRDAADQTRAGNAGGRPDQGDGARRPRAAIDPAQVTVAVLNGTTTTGLAADVGDTVSGEGFQLGNITNSTDQQRAESVVLYAQGAERDAVEVARRLDITQREQIDPESQGLAGDASVVVVVGQDKVQ